MLMSDKNLIPLVFCLTPLPPQNYSDKKLKSFVMLLSIRNQDKQQNKLNYIHCEEVYLVDSTKGKITKYETVDCAGAGLDT